MINRKRCLKVAQHILKNHNSGMLSKDDLMNYLSRKSLSFEEFAEDNNMVKLINQRYVINADLDEIETELNEISNSERNQRHDWKKSLTIAFLSGILGFCGGIGSSLIIDNFKTDKYVSIQIFNKQASEYDSKITELEDKIEQLIKFKGVIEQKLKGED